MILIWEAKHGLWDMTSNKIIITGFMGSGKTVVAKKLNELYGYSSVDLDKEIEKKEKLKVNDIFLTKGEKYFRRLESDVLTDILDSDVEVIALGGGTLNNTFLLDLVLSYKNCFYIKTEFKTLWKRISRTDRPLVKKGYDKTLALYNLREKYYNLLHYTIIADNLTVKEIAQEIKLSVENG